MANTNKRKSYSMTRTVTISISDDLLLTLTDLALLEKVSRSEIVRQGIELVRKRTIDTYRKDSDV